ncbi:mismatch repair ATPase MSH6 [Spathaspora passalidarum NRRL Y-27907]|uniref:DNA mismatch repair protein n=1 Tax=Spathaspora passalidarum (strain NRRL Y-27907 / 11-Y1) TaxID=619300 RepID=G3AN91_SPAPN|nr:mismatch repair ATPase MSH6 [Spathaspora passalidarum NRRL Y-27907]EGW32474.1 mismatch repair ATPase MSH6 [Spathaspora passalidarum NRRL Y-27907]
MSDPKKKPTTPLKPTKTNAGGGSTGSQKKQSSLMAFFKPVAKSDSKAPVPPPQLQNKQPQLPSSSPLKSKSVKNEILSDKENEQESTSANTSFNAPDSSFTSYSSKKEKMADADEISQVKVAKTHLNKAATNLNSSPVTKRGRGTKNISYAESSDEEEEEDDIKVGKKRRKVIADDSDNDDEFTPAGEEPSDDDMSDFIVDDDKDEDSPVEEEGEEEEDNDDDVPLRTKQPKKATKSMTPTKRALDKKFNAKSAYSPSNYTPVKSSPSTKVTPVKKSFAKENEERYQWLVNIKDAEKRTPDDPEYDSRTLYIPQAAWSKFTAFEKQYWEIKSKMWTTVVFFKKGKFYELYENDAIIANTEFDLKIAGGGRANMKLAGIPEMSFEYWAKEFISHGYKVAKVDQKESLLAKEMRGGSTKEEKIIKRELTGILTGGTLTDLDMISDDMSTYCLSIKEEEKDDGSKIFGVAFVDTSTSELNLIELEDDPECTKLDTLITQVKPKEIICEKGNLCGIANKILKFCAHNNHQIWNQLNPITEFWDYDVTVENLVTSKYYPAEDLDDFSQYPVVLTSFKEKHQVAFNAFGGLLYYLKTLKLDSSIMSLGNIHEYRISRNEASHLILDGITLNNLEILNNSTDGGDKGTLFKLLNRATTPFGKRQLKKWILYPLMKINEINQRYDAVDYLMNDGLEIRSIVESCLNELPDLERLLARIHAGNLRFRDFLKVVESFESIAKCLNQLGEFTNVESGAFYKYIREFPQEIARLITEWEDAFDREQAKNDVIIPAKGIDEQFDESQAIIDDLQGQLDQHLKEYKKRFKSHEICYRDSGKEIYLIEFPVKLVKQIPNDWQQMGATSKVKRFWSPEVRKLVRELLEQRERHKMVCDTLRNRMYSKFDSHYNIWMKVIATISKIDCLLALAKVSGTIGYPSCRPKFVDSDRGYINFQELRHPCFISTREFIPNDVMLGGDQPHFGLLTGANAAGKSTLMRTTALAVILSQIGCYIPAQSAELTPVDRIMTRLGANDNILQGKSTFFVELSETKKILSNATPRSLVILDELGRGGSSSDGFAIAEAVLYHLATHLQSLGFFATHYGTLGASFKTHPQIKPLRMGIIVDSNTRNITFLYKLEEGAASGSFGMNVASMCGISDEIVVNAEMAAKNYEQTSKSKKSNLPKIEDGLSLGLQSDFAWIAKEQWGVLSKDILNYEEPVKQHALENIFTMIDQLSV